MVVICGNMGRRYIILFLMCWNAALWAQPIPLFRHFTTVDGLPSSQIYQVLQDSKGYLWFSSDHGLTRYNGYDFKTYTSADGLLDNTVFKIQEGKDGKMWMQTSSGRLHYIQNDKVYSYKYNDTVVKLSGTNIPLAFYMDSLEQLNFISSWIGEYRIDSIGNSKQVMPFNTGAGYNKIHFHTTDTRRIISSGNFVNDAKHNCWLYYSFGGAAFDSIFIPAKYSGHLCVARDRNDKIYLSISKHLFEWSDDSLRLLKSFPGTISCLFFNDKNHLWVGTYSGMYHMDSVNDSTPDAYLAHDFISCIINDNENGLWVTTVNNGVYYLSGRKIQSFHFEKDQLNEPLCLTHDGNMVYAGFWSGRMIAVNSSGYTIKYVAEAGNYLNKLFASDGKIYISKSDPGFLYKGKFTKFKPVITRTFKGAFIKRRDGSLYNISVKNIFKIKNESEVEVMGGINERTNCSFETSDGKLLIGTNNGAYIINENNFNLTRHEPLLTEVRIDDISSLREMILFATRGKGLAVKNDDKVHFIGVKEGLTSNLIHRIYIYKNIVWCASYNGISKVTILNDNPFRYSIENISAEDGLPGNEINDVLVCRDTVWLATKSSISFFPVDAQFSNPVPPRVYFNSIKINNKVTDVLQAQSIPYSSNSISIGFEGISYRSSGKILYKYTLVNEKDSLTSITRSRQVEFLSLKPGKYFLEVMAQNHSGTWSSNPAKMEFIILSPFWQQWWFIALCCLVLAGVIYIYLKVRISRVKKEEAMKTDFNRQLAELEMKALRSQMNPHFIFNVMNSIQDYILKNDARSAQRYLTRFAKLVRLILDNSMMGEIVLNQELKAAEIYIELEQQRFDNKFEFQIFIEEDVDSESLLIPSMIIQPYLENAIKHGISHLNEQGKVMIKIKKEKGALNINIEDNGVGRKAASAFNSKNVRDHVSYGSEITGDRIKAYNIANNTNIRTVVTDLIDSFGNACGTQVTLIIPLKYR
jgi:ligand-binding sensor domain-containing protein